MASDNLVIDTNIFIEYLRAKDKPNTTLYAIPDGTTPYISVVTLYELYMGANTDDKRKDVQQLTKGIIILPVNEDVAEQAAAIYHELRKTNHLIEFRDIFIGATSMVYNFPLLTINKKHFTRIKGLSIV